MRAIDFALLRTGLLASIRLCRCNCDPEMEEVCGFDIQRARLLAELQAFDAMWGGWINGSDTGTMTVDPQDELLNKTNKLNNSPPRPREKRKKKGR